jgi:hypothetical protein
MFLLKEEPCFFCGRGGRDRVLVWFTTEFESRSWRGVLDTTLSDLVFQ